MYCALTWRQASRQSACNSRRPDSKIQCPGLDYLSVGKVTRLDLFGGPGLDRLAGFIVDHARQILGLTAVITLLAVAMLFRMDFNADVASFILEGNETGEAFSELQNKYESGDPITVVVELTDDATFRQPASLARLVDFIEVLEAVEGVDGVASMVPEVNPLTGAALTSEAVAATPPQAIAGLIDRNPVAEVLISPDGTATMLFVTSLDDPVATARTLSELPVPEGTEVTLAGNPVIFAQVFDVLSLILLAVPPLVIILMLSVFYLNIGDRRLSALAIMPAIVGSLWTFGTVFALGRQVDIITVIVPIFVIVMGSADGLHFITHFQDKATETEDKVVMVASALRHVGVPMILTTVSTAVGFLSLTFTGVKPIAELGVFAAVGIGFAGVISLFALPALMSRLTITPAHTTAILGPRVTRALERVIATRRPAIGLTFLILLFAIVFIPRLSVDPDQLFFFKADDPVRIAFETTEELFGGATPLFGEFVYDPATGFNGLAGIAAVQRELEALPGIRKVFSLADLADALPPDQVERFLGGTAALPFGQMVSGDGLRYIIFPSDFGTDDLRGWLEFAEDEPQIKLLTGMPVVWDEIARLVLRSQVVSLVAAFLLVTALLGISYRRLRETVISIIPIALTVLTLLAFLAASGIQLNLMTAVLSSIVIGVGIDYAIHFIAAIDLARASGVGYAFRAIRSAGRPIVANALGIAVAMTALWLSPLAIHSQVSMIMWVSMTVAAATALLVIPALLPEEAIDATSQSTAEDN